MKILIYDNAFHIVNGASKYILYVVKMLFRREEVYLLGDAPFNSDFLKHFYDIDIAPEQILNLNFRQSKGPFKKIENNLAHIKKCRRISEITREYDLFINNNGGFHYQIEPKSKKSIMLFHFLMDPFHSFRYPERFKKIKNLCRRIIFPHPDQYNFVSRYHKAVSISEFTKKWVIKWQRRGDLEIINPPIPLPQSNTPKKENIILSVSRFAPLGPDGDGKGRLEMIKAFKILYNQGIKNYILILAGGRVFQEGTQRYIEKLKEMAKGYPVEFRLDLEQNELNKVYSRAKIFWHLMGLGIDEQSEPHKLEPFGMVTAEAMSYGVVPVVVNAGGQKEIIKSGESGFLINNLEELLGKTQYLCENDNEWKELSKEAKERSKIFSQDRFFKSWQEVFSQIGLNRR